MSQPNPVKNDNIIIHEQLIKLIQERLDFGIKKYGTPLQPFNDRRSLSDALDEALDLSVYLLQEIVEREALDKKIKDLLRENDRLKTQIQYLEYLKSSNGPGG